MTKRTCIEIGCERTHYGRGWCKTHYHSAWRSGSIEDHPRTLARPDASTEWRLRNLGWTVTENGCWEWNGSRDKLGYGQLSICGTPRKAYRVAYETWVKMPEPGMDICHRCDNPPCINPAHLFEGTRRKNIDDMVSKERQANGENRPHKLSDKQVDAIRMEYGRGHVTQRALAVRYGVCQQLISGIVRHKNRAKETFARKR